MYLAIIHKQKREVGSNQLSLITESYILPTEQTQLIGTRIPLFGKVFEVVYSDTDYKKCENAITILKKAEKKAKKEFLIQNN